VALAPTNLASAAMSRVFYREASLHWGSPRLTRLATALTGGGLLASLPLFAFLLVWGDNLFAICFGDRWNQAGEFAQVLAVPLWLALQNGWPERVFEVAGRQRVSFTLQMGSDAVQASVLVVAFTLTHDPLATISCYAVSYTAYQVAYLFTVYRIAKFPVRPLVRTLVLNAFLMVAAASLLAVFRSTSPWESGLTLVLSAGLACCSSALAAHRIWRAGI
jgi:O-antigen/teichoic acid export membrane protein